ncbi:hypothetical protein Barb7_00699 [Bacteroidales bacterium Barb7]|nr:hypothetical protein Barb7_00699 [Bacteroidales bacterium Barb7]
MGTVRFYCELPTLRNVHSSPTGTAVASSATEKRLTPKRGQPFYFPAFQPDWRGNYSQPRVVCFSSGLELRIREGMGNTS